MTTQAIATILLITITVILIAMPSVIKSEKVAEVVCTDLITGDTVVCRVKYTGIITPLNKSMLLNHASEKLTDQGVLPNELIIVK